AIFARTSWSIVQGDGDDGFSVGRIRHLQAGEASKACSVGGEPVEALLAFRTGRIHGAELVQLRLRQAGRDAVVAGICVDGARVVEPAAEGRNVIIAVRGGDR